MSGARETSVEMRQSSAKIENSYFKSNFLNDGAKIWPPNLGFWTPALANFPIINAIFQKN